MLSLIFEWDGLRKTSRHKRQVVRTAITFSTDALHSGEMGAVGPTSTSGFSVAQCQAQENQALMNFSLVWLMRSCITGVHLADL